MNLVVDNIVIVIMVINCNLGQELTSEIPKETYTGEEILRFLFEKLSSSRESGEMCSTFAVYVVVIHEIHNFSNYWHLSLVRV